MTRSARGLVALVSIALLAVVLVAAERMRPPADPIEVAATPAVPQPAGAPVSDAKPVAPSGSADERAFPAESQPAPKPLLVPASATVATPAPPVAEPEPPATRVESAVVAAVVSDAPPPPAAPVRKKPVVARATPEKAPPVKPSAPVGPYMLQLAAFASEKSAYGEAARLQKALGTVLGERKVMVVEGANAEKKPIWRLRASSYPTLATARAACQSIRKLKTGCLVIRR